MRSLKKPYQGEIILDMSRFIGIVIPIQTVEEALENLTEIKSQYPNATHYCYAYIVGDNQESQKASDDGEPQKTAGIPMLEVLKKNDLTNVLAITIRYFGGKLLGASGLVRAYTKSISSLLVDAEYSYKLSYTIFDLTIGYKEHHQIEPILNDRTSVLSASYSDEIHLKIKIATDQYPELVTSITEKIHSEPTIENHEVIEIYE
ncbi:MAG: YigZ family protein [Candidatus Izemoplasmatales bacterium]